MEQQELEKSLKEMDLHTCLFCKKYNLDTKTCSEGVKVIEPRKQVCEKWRYVA